MRIIKHENVWADTAVHTEGYMLGKRGQRITYRDKATQMVATCLADTTRYYLASRITPLCVNGQLYLRQSGHSVLVRRLSGRHLQAAEWRLNQLRKKNSNVHNPKNHRSNKLGRFANDVPATQGAAAESR